MEEKQQQQQTGNLFLFVFLFPLFTPKIIYSNRMAFCFVQCGPKSADVEKKAGNGG